MRISDWSSDVCSSDLVAERGPPRLAEIAAPARGDRAVEDLQRQRLERQHLVFQHQLRRQHHRAQLALFDVAAHRRVAAGAVGVQLQRQRRGTRLRSEEHTSELQSLMRISYAVFCLKKKNTNKHYNTTSTINHTSLQ